MADNTNRFGLNTYSQGDTGWDHTDTVETIDELAIERGAAADRPASGDYDDELYLATDQQILYRWDETETDWIVEGVGSESDPLPKVWANEIEADSLNTGEANIEELNYEYTDASPSLIETVGTDTIGETIQYQRHLPLFDDFEHNDTSLYYNPINSGGGDIDISDIAIFGDRILENDSSRHDRLRTKNNVFWPGTMLVGWVGRGRNGFGFTWDADDEDTDEEYSYYLETDLGGSSTVRLRLRDSRGEDTNLTTVASSSGDFNSDHLRRMYIGFDVHGRICGGTIDDSGDIQHMEYKDTEEADHSVGEVANTLFHKPAKIVFRRNLSSVEADGLMFMPLLPHFTQWGDV